MLCCRMPDMSAHLKGYCIPLVIFILFVGLYIGYSLVSDNFFLFKPVWDVQHYVNIAERGYEAHPCTPSDYPPGKICGNVGWYPSWPLVIRLVGPVFGGNSQAAYIFLALALSLASFILLYRFVLSRFDRTAATLTLLATAFGPASFYFISGFPYALFFCLFMVYLHLLYAPGGAMRDIILFLSGLALSASYPTGILVALVPAVWYVFALRSRNLSILTLRTTADLLKYVIPFALGVLLLWVYFHFRFDNFFIQLDFQARYQRTWAIPLVVIAKSLVSRPLLSAENIVILWYGLAFLLFLPYRIKPELWVLGLVLYLFSPATGSTMSLYRHYLLIFPVYMLIGTSRRPLWLKAAVIAIGLVLALAVVFPQFIASRLI